MGLTERHWFENEDVPENDEWALEDAVYNSRAMEKEQEARELTDLLDLLKKQNRVDPKFVGVNTWICSECGALLGWENVTQGGLELVKYKFCSHCKKVVKWE